MSDFKPVDRSKRGELLKQWTSELEEATARVRKASLCPTCGFPMVYSGCAPAPCSTSPSPGSDDKA